MKTDFLTPVGRLVQGDPFEAQTKNMQGQPLMTMSGQPTQRYFIALAFAKNNPPNHPTAPNQPNAEFAAFYQKLVDTARGSFPALFNAQGQCSHPRFSWKLMDGDGVDDNGKSNATKEGFAGHWVVKFSSSFAPRCFHAGHYQPHEQIQDPKAIQRGYFVRVAGTIEGNENPTKPGLYVNLSMVELAGVGPIISSGPDASAVFGGAAAQLPAGAQPLPMNAGAMPGAAPFPLPGASIAAAPSLPNMNVGMPPAGPATISPSSPAPLAIPPNPAFLAGPAGVAASAPVVGTPSAPMAPAFTAPSAPPSSPQMTAKAGGATYEQFKSQGWADDQMRAQGYLV